MAKRPPPCNPEVKGENVGGGGKGGGGGQGVWLHVYTSVGEGVWLCTLVGGQGVWFM